MQEADYYDSAETHVFEFSKVNTRLAFIRKVYLILASQLTFTAVLISVGLASDSYKDFLVNHIPLLVVAAIINITCAYALFCYRNVARAVPQNYILLGAFTFTEAFLFSSFTSWMAW